MHRIVSLEAVFCISEHFLPFRTAGNGFHRIGYAPFEAFRANLLFFGPYVKKYSNPKFSRFQWLFFPSGRKNFFLA